MNPEWFGDSYDIVKRFFASSLLDLNYDVYIDPMITGEWGGDLDTLYDFLKMRPLSEYRDSAIDASGTRFARPRSNEQANDLQRATDRAALAQPRQPRGGRWIALSSNRGNWTGIRAA